MSQINVDVGIRNGPFKNGLDQMRAQTESWSKEVKNSIAGVFAFGSMLAWFNAFRNEMGRVQDMADRFGQSTKAIQQVGNVAKVSGTDIEQLATILTKLTLEAAKSADQFAAVGINVADFATAGYDQQILMLSAAWEAANGDTEKQIALMQLLGAKGQELLPMLSKGVAQLAEEFAAVPVVSDAAVAGLSRFNDGVDNLNISIKSGIGNMMDWLGFAWQMGKTIAQGGSQQEMTDRLVDAVAAPDTKSTAITGGPKGFATEEDQKTAQDEAKKQGDAMKALEAEMLELARSRMDEEAKIADLKREQAEQSALSKDQSKSESDRLAAAKKVLELQQQIESGETAIAKKAQDEQDKTTELAKKQAAEVLKAESAAAEEEERQRLAKLDPAARISELKSKQKALFDEAAKLKESDPKTAAEKRLEALKLNGDIDAAQKELDGSPTAKARNPSVISSSLASIGGGGGAYVTGLDPGLQESRRQTSLLQQIVQNTSRSGSAAGGGLDNPF